MKPKSEIDELRAVARIALQQFEFMYGQRKRGWDAAYLMKRLRKVLDGPQCSLENTTAFKAYNQAIEDAKAAIRGEHVDDPYAAATFINAIARKCSPHVYVNRLATIEDDLAYADGYADGFRQGKQSRQPADPKEPCSRCAGSRFETDGYTPCEQCGKDVA
jgi:hypothetical protein